jgi:putative oxidoreductase
MQRYFTQFTGGRIGGALLLLRAVVGLAFMFHGWPKITNIDGFAASMKLPWFLAAAAAASEFLGGLCLILGLLTPLAALMIAVVMAVALFKVHLPAGDPFVSAGGKSYELAAVYLASMIAFLMAGPGAYSLDAKLVSHLMRTGEEAPLIERHRGVA